MDLEKFARKMFELSGWPDGGDIDGCSFQDAAVECGLLTEVIVYQPCGERCQCVEYYDQDGMKEGVTCYRKSEFLLHDDE